MNYLINCSRCSLQYVGETVQKLHNRFNWNRTGFHQPSKYRFYQTISSKISIQIFEKFEEDKRTARMSSLHLEGSNVRKMDTEAGR